MEILLYRSLSERLENQHETLQHLVDAATGHRLTYHPAPGKWSAKDNIAHPAAYQPVFTGRIHSILEENSPVFGGYVADTDPGFEAIRSHSVSELIRMLHADRAVIYSLLTGLPPARLARTGIHPKFGTLTVVQWTEFFLLHEAHHLFTIFRLVYDGQDSR